MAEPLELDTWEGRGVRLGDVTAALGDLRRQSGDRSSARTAVMTLVAVAPSDEQAYPCMRALRSLAGQHPARIVLLRPDQDRVAALDARATLYAAPAGDAGRSAIHFEQISLTIGGQAANHLDSFVEGFTLPDLPVVVWFVGGVPDPADPLLQVATAVLVDSRDASDPGLLRSLLELARRRPVVDLCWIRLEPWRRLLAALFDPPDLRPWLTTVQSVAVRGKVGPRQLLGGWLRDRLALEPAQVSLMESNHVEIHLACRAPDGGEASFEVLRGSGPRTVSARASLPDGSLRQPQPVPLADDPLSLSLERALTGLGADTVWEHALSGASALAS